jgi:hypothetical protein
MPVSNHVADAIIGSPPYCTRIDYVIGTLPELAVLGYTRNLADALLRDDMIGSPRLTPTDPWPRQQWGSTAATFHSSVAAHKSKASSTYYARYFAQYFERLAESFADMARVARTGGKAVLVVQDSYYKELRLPLADVTTEMLIEAGWDISESVSFTRKTTKAAMNPRSRKYRRTHEAIETVVIAEKKG